MNILFTCPVNNTSSHFSPESTEADVILFVDDSPNDTVSPGQLSVRFGSDIIAIAEELANHRYLDRVYSGGYRLQFNGRQEAMRLRLMRKKMNEQHAHQKREQDMKDQQARKEAQTRITEEHIHADTLQLRDHAFQLNLNKSNIRHSWIQWAFTTIISIVSFLLGAFFQYGTDIIDRFLSLFH